MTSYYGNPHSRTHQYGWESEEAVETARSQIARLIGAEPKEGMIQMRWTLIGNISILLNSL